jgi:hypothetical protein
MNSISYSENPPPAAFDYDDCFNYVFLSPAVVALPPYLFEFYDDSFGFFLYLPILPILIAPADSYSAFYLLADYGSSSSYISFLVSSTNALCFSFGSNFYY